MAEDKVQILVIGLGALGTIYSHLLEKSGKCQVTAVARSTFKTFNGPGVTIQSQKFGIVKKWKPHRVFRSIDEVQDRQYTYILVCTKALPEVTPTANLLRPLLNDNHARVAPAVVLIQNGLGIEKPLRKEFPDITIISCCAWIGAHFIVSQGVVEHGMFERLDMGVFTQEAKQTDQDRELYLKSARGGHEARLLSCLAIYVREGGGDAVEKDEIQIARWHKNMWHVVAGLPKLRGRVLRLTFACTQECNNVRPATVRYLDLQSTDSDDYARAIFCCLARSSVASIVSEKVLESTLPALRRTMLEVLYVARNMGFDETVLPARVIDSLLKLTIQTWGTEGSVMKSAPASLRSNAVNPSLLPEFPKAAYYPGEIDASSLQSVGPDFRPSMLIDVETNRPTELEAVLGSVLDRARLNGTDTPRLDLLYSLMKIKQQAALDAESERLSKTVDYATSPRSCEPCFAASPRTDKVRGRPVFTPAIEMDEKFESSWPSLV